MNAINQAMEVRKISNKIAIIKKPKLSLKRDGSNELFRMQSSQYIDSINLKRREDTSPMF